MPNNKKHLIKDYQEKAQKMESIIAKRLNPLQYKVRWGKNKKDTW